MIILDCVKLLIQYNKQKYASNPMGEFMDMGIWNCVIYWLISERQIVLLNRKFYSNSV